MTICAWGKRYRFGVVRENVVHLNRLGHALGECWEEIPRHFAEVELDAFVVMPNHLHGIVVIHEAEGTACRAPTVERYGKPVRGSLPTIVRSFKSAATRTGREILAPGAVVWQRGYYEHIIRDEHSWQKVREYIATNPERWGTDWENPQRSGEDKFRVWLDSFKGRPGGSRPHSEGRR